VLVLNPTVTFHPVQLLGTPLAVVVGATLSYVHVISLLASFPFPILSVAVSAAILAFAVPKLSVVAFTVHTYTVLLTDLKLTTLAFVNVKSHVATPLTHSLYVPVIVYVVHHFLHCAVLLVNVTVGF
jgi:hypothetical protein